MTQAPPVSATITTHAPEETEALGQRLGARLQAGDVVALVGPLGTGKTVLSRGIATGAGAIGYIASPSFTVIREYDGPVRVYHVDLYRLDEPGDIAYLGLDDLISGEGIVLLEWAERAEWMLPPGHLRIVCANGADATTRIFTFTISASMLERLAPALSA